MSEGRDLPCTTATDKPKASSEPDFRTARVPREPTRSTVARVLDYTRRELSERTRRVLNYSSDDSDEIEAPAQIITEREFEFDVDSSLIPPAVREHRHRLPSDSSVSNVSQRGEFSLTSYDSSVFDPNFENDNMDKHAALGVPPVDTEDVDREIERLRTEATRRTTEGHADPRPGPSRAHDPPERGYSLARDDYALPRVTPGRVGRFTGVSESVTLAAVMQELRALHTRMDDLSDRVDGNREPPPPRDQPQPIYLGDTESEKRIEKARSMIPMFDGSNEEKLKGFIKACSYAYRKIHPYEEEELTQAIVCTKLTDRALTEVENRDLSTFRQLKETLEACYPTKKTTAQLQREFNTVRQRIGEDARTYGNRVERLAIEWAESATEGTQMSTAEKRTIQDFIKSQALTNYQLGLNERLQTIVRSRAPATLAAAISEAVAEERVKGFTGYSTRPIYSRGRTEESFSRTYQKPSSCSKCGKIGHIGRDCRTSRYAMRFSLPRPEGWPRVNTTYKYCSYCQRSGHTKEECWKIRGQVNNTPANSRVPRETRKVLPPPTTKQGEGRRANQEKTEKVKYSRNQKINEADSNHINTSRKPGPLTTGLELVLIPVKESKEGSVPFLFDTGSAITFVKARALEGETIFTPEEVTLTGVTGHHLKTLGYFNAHIKIGPNRLRHKIYIVRNSFPIDYEGILGADFIQKHKMICDYSRRKVTIRKQRVPLIPLESYLVPARSETVISATTSTSKIGIVESREIKPGVYIGNCLVNAVNHICAVSVINTTEEAVKLKSPYVMLEDVPEKEETKGVNTIQNRRKGAGTPIGRFELLKQSLRLLHLNIEEQKSIASICEEFCEIFFLEGDSLTVTDAVRHSIAVKTDTAPVNVRPYRLPKKHIEEVDKQISEMQRNKIIKPSRSQWNAPLLVVPKKPDSSGKTKLRVVIDFRKLNDLTIGDSFPLPNITEILDQLGSAKYFTTLDLASGYHQISMSKRDREKTAFSTANGHYEFNRMPFGLKNAPATFQRLMNTILTGLQGIDCLVYLDDIVVYGSSLQEHNMRLRKIFQRLRDNNLKLQPDKCEFLRKEVAYLGHVISEKGILPDPSKINAVKDFPVPKKEKDIQSFLGLAGYYRRFIENFSKIAKPLTLLTKKGQIFNWTIAQEKAFLTLKNKLTTAPLLQFPDFTREFVITTDASDFAIGAILSQGEIGQDKPIAFASRILTRAEQNYNTTEKELLAIVWAVKHFRPYVYGTKFKIVTDHKPLVWLFNVTDPGSRLIRWRLKLEEYDYEIVHKAGKANTNADALSRKVQANALTTNTGVTSEKHNATSDYKNASISDSNERSNLGNVRDYTEEEKKQILYEYHDAPLGGHQGVQRTINRIRLNHNWVGLTVDVKKYIDKCQLCQKNKLFQRNKSPLVITDTPDKPFEKCALDIVGPLTMTENGNKYILTFQDNLTKFSKAIPLPNQEASTVARAFVTKIILEYGIPQKVLTDQGTNFLSNIFKNVCRLLKIEKIQTTAYHPQSNGALERSHRTLAEYLRHYINIEQTDWDNWLPYAMFAYNTTPHTSTNYTPFELLYGHRAELPTSLTLPPAHTYTVDDYASEIKERIRAANRIAKENNNEEKEKSKRNYDRKAKPNIFFKGDKVLLYDETVRRGRSKKLESLWIGPYVITEKHSDINYTIKKGRKMLKVHANRIKLFIDH